VCITLLTVNSIYTTKPHGLGMGLAISRSIVAAHGGRLWATANVLHGAVFQFTVPMGGGMMDAEAMVFVVDDDAPLRESLKNLIRSVGLGVEAFASAQEFLRSPRPDVPGCLVLDVQLPGLSGLDLQQELDKVHCQIPIIFITGHGDIPMTVRAMKAGAIEFLTKPCRDDDLLHAVEQAIHRSRQLAPGKHPPADEQPYAAEELPRDSSVSAIVGHSAALRSVLTPVETVAPTDATVLLSGGTGTGKEVIARAIYRLSRRGANPFVKLNCAAIPPACWKASSSATRKARSPAPLHHASAASSWCTAGRCFSTRSVICPSSYSPSCCGCSKSANSSGWEAPGPCTPMPA
jgi:FixJ family two-component response regulator